MKNLMRSVTVSGLIALTGCIGLTEQGLKERSGHNNVISSIVVRPNEKVSSSSRKSGNKARVIRAEQVTADNVYEKVVDLDRELTREEEGLLDLRAGDE